MIKTNKPYSTSDYVRDGIVWTTASAVLAAGLLVGYAKVKHDKDITDWFTKPIASFVELYKEDMTLNNKLIVEPNKDGTFNAHLEKHPKVIVHIGVVCSETGDSTYGRLNAVPREGYKNTLASKIDEFFGPPRANECTNGVIGVEFKK